MRAYLSIFAATIVTAVACGARTGLDVPPPPVVDAGPDVVDAGPDVVDAPPDVLPDAPVIDECQDAGTTYIYVITEENVLYSFYPPDGAFKAIGVIDCPSPVANDTPFSMGVDRAGIAHVVFQSGNLFRVSTATASCEATPYAPTPFGAGQTFGMGFSANVADAGETLFVASDDGTNGGTQPELLGTIDLSAFQLDVVGPFPHHIGSAELTGTGDGHLYAFGVDQQAAGTSYRLLELDKTSAGIVSESPLSMPTGSQAIQAWAFAYWGGDFYFFTSVQGMTHSSIVSKYHAGDSPVAAQQIMIADNVIVGAGVSTCAPQQ